MMDAGHEETEAILKVLEGRVNREYAKAQKEVKSKLTDYLRRFEVKDRLKRQALAAGLITPEEYQKWRVGQMMVGERWSAMQGTLASDYANYAQIARSAAFEHMPEVYAVNINYGTYQIEHDGLVDTSYVLYDRHTVERLLVDDKGDFIPAPGRKLTQKINAGLVKRWNTQNVQSVMLQGILQGESIPAIATRLAESVGEQNRKVSIRNARTLTTGVQNAGRLAAYDRARRMGIKVRKQWLATLDQRTRHWHRELDGVVVDNDQPFHNEYGDIMYPGDPMADPANIFNCRCTTIGSVEGYERDASNLLERNTDHLGDMTYNEWKAQKKSYSDPILKQDQISLLMRRVYGAEYAKYRILGAQ